MSRGGCKGFTLLEVMVVLTILALTLSLVVPALSRGVSPSLDDVAQDISTGIRQARNAALATQQATTFVIDLQHYTYVVRSGETKSIPKDVFLRASVASNEVSAKAVAFRFFPDGSSTGGTLSLTQGDASLAVEVDWLTGKVVIAERSGAR